MIDLVEHHRPKLAALCRQFNVQRLDVFGSAARGNFDPDRSDLDFLVTLKAPSPSKYADNYLGLAHALEVGKANYIAEACWHCHSQFVRPVSNESLRFGPVSTPEE